MAYFTPNLPVDTEEARMDLARKIARVVRDEEGNFFKETNAHWDPERRRYDLDSPPGDWWLFPPRSGSGEQWRLVSRYHDEALISRLLEPFMK